MFKFIKDYIRKQALRGLSKNSSGTFLNIKDIHTIGFLYNVESEEYLDELNAIIKFLDKEGILYFGLAVETKKGILPQIESIKDVPEYLKEMEEKGVFFVENIYVNWAGVPSSDKIESFLKRETDLFISLNGSGNFTLEYISRESKAKLTVGMHDYPNSTYTFVLEGENKSTLSYNEYLTQIFHYLNVIKGVRK